MIALIVSFAMNQGWKKFTVVSLLDVRAANCRWEYFLLRNLSMSRPEQYKRQPNEAALKG